MSENPNHSQVAVQYLLGTLSESETERLDELSFTDDEFAESLRAAENDLMDAYAQGELSEADRKQFVLHYLGTTRKRERLKFAQGLYEWAEREESAEVKPRVSEPRKQHWFPGRVLFGAQPLAVRWGAALAALILLVATGILLFQNLRLRQQLRETQARSDELRQSEQKLQEEMQAQRSAAAAAEQEIARLQNERQRSEPEPAKSGTEPAPAGGIVSLILAPPLRGAAEVRTLSVPPGANRVRVLLQLEAADYSAYRVELVDPVARQTLWRRPNLKPSRQGLDISFPADLLKPRHYLLRVIGITSGAGSEIVGDYPFKVVR